MKRLLRAAGLLAVFAALWLSTTGLGGLSRGGGSLNPGIRYPYKVAYITDTHVSWVLGGLTPRTAYHFGRMIDTCNTLGVEAMIWGGDWSEDTFQDQNNAGNVDSLNAITARARFPIWPVIGNHEAWRGDTAGVIGYDAEDNELYGTPRQPYYTAIQRHQVSSYLNGLTYHGLTFKNIDFIALQNNCNYSVGADGLTDYMVNNPSTIPAPNGVTGYDFDGITLTNSPQRLFLRNFLRSRNKSHWLFVAAHRPIYGQADASFNPNRQNFMHNLRTTHFIKEVEDSMATGERFLYLGGDQHWTYVTNAVRDSALASATGKGGYHIANAASGHHRAADSTAVLAGLRQSFLFYNTTQAYAKGSHASWIHNLAPATDPQVSRTYTWQLLTVYGDHIQIDTYRTFGTDSPGSITQGAMHRLIDRRTISRDVG